MNDVQNDCAWNYGDENLSIGMFMRDYVCWIIVTGFDRMKWIVGRCIWVIFIRSMVMTIGMRCGGWMCRYEIWNGSGTFTVVKTVVIQRKWMFAMWLCYSVVVGMWFGTYPKSEMNGLNYLSGQKNGPYDIANIFCCMCIRVDVFKHHFCA